MFLRANYSREKNRGDEQPFPSRTPNEIKFKLAVMNKRKAVLQNAGAPEKKPVIIKHESSRFLPLLSSSTSAKLSYTNNSKLME